MSIVFRNERIKTAMALGLKVEYWSVNKHGWKPVLSHYTIRSGTKYAVMWDDNAPNSVVYYPPLKEHPVPEDDLNTRYLRKCSDYATLEYHTAAVISTLTSQVAQLQDKLRAADTSDLLQRALAQCAVHRQEIDRLQGQLRGVVVAIKPFLTQE